jgi:hypothetical protein
MLVQLKNHNRPTSTTNILITTTTTVLKPNTKFVTRYNRLTFHVTKHAHEWKGKVIILQLSRSFFLPKPLYIFTLVTKHVAESYLSI